MFFGLAVLTQTLTYQQYLIYEQSKIEKISDEANAVRDRLKSALSFSLSATKTLAYLVETYGVPKNFDSVAIDILEANQYIDAVELTRKGVITHVFPLEPNRAAIGYDVLSDSLRSEEALKSLETKKLFFAGPFELKQGGLSVVGRLPIFRDGEFFGFSVVLIKLQTLLRAAGIDKENDRFSYQLSKTNPFTLEEEYFISGALSNPDQYISVEVPDGEWKLYVKPKHANGMLEQVLPFSLLGIILSATAGVFAWHLAQQPIKLKQQVQEVTRLSDSIINSLPGVFYLYDREGKFLRWNKNFEIVTGYSGAEIMRMHPLDFFKGLYKVVLKEKIDEVFSSGYAEVMANFHTKPGVDIPYYFNGQRVNFEGTDYLIGMGLDITDRVHAEQVLLERADEIEKLSSHLQNVREEERSRIALEIHDVLGQQLTALKMDATWLRKKTDDPGINERVSAMIRIIDDTIKNVRRISSELRPGILDDLGLIAALEWQGNEFQKSSGIAVKFESNKTDIELEKNLATNLFRIYQEALTNVARHANASLVTAAIVEQDARILMTISDNGSGFNLEEAKLKKSLGLISMRERARLFGGELTIERNIPQGTIVSVSIPAIKKVSQNS